MGERKPRRLGEKLRYVRKYFNRSQSQMIGEVETEDYTSRSAISRFENGKKEPPLEVLLRYIDFVNRQGTYRISLDILCEDVEDLSFPD